MTPSRGPRAARPNRWTGLPKNRARPTQTDRWRGRGGPSPPHAARSPSLPPDDPDADDDGILDNQDGLTDTDGDGCPDELPPPPPVDSDGDGLGGHQRREGRGRLPGQGQREGARRGEEDPHPRQ